MKRILCYGDSNTWGYNASTRLRYPSEIRWTGVLASILGAEYFVIEEGLVARTTVLDDPLFDGRNGIKYLQPCIETHNPLDIIVLLLGTNDLKLHFSMEPVDIAAGLKKLVLLAQQLSYDSQMTPSQVILVTPPLVGEDLQQSRLYPQFGVDARARSEELASLLPEICNETKSIYFDATQIFETDPADSIHLSERGHKLFAQALAEKIISLNG